MRLLIVLIVFLAASCCKEPMAEKPFVEGKIIGFDPCTANSATGRGYVVAIQGSPDTLAVYNLPDTIFTFPQSLFTDFRNNYLFSAPYQDSFKLRMRYHIANSSEHKLIFCYTDINWSGFYSTTKNRQIIIEEARK